MSFPVSQEEKIKQGAEDSGRYFRYMAEYVGFGDDEVQAIKDSRFIIEKHLPAIVSKFYTQLLRYPPTRKYFLKPDGSLDQEYLQLRMHHLTNFWRRTADGVFDDNYARYVDYVGRAHTSRGADPNIYIADRYVIGQVGFIQHAISEALTQELHQIDPELEARALKAWNLLMMVILEMLSRAYGYEREAETYAARATVDHEAVLQIAVQAYELGLGMRTDRERQDVIVGRTEEIPDGERKIVQVDDLSIGVFHHEGNWYAVRNSCQHRGGPVATGKLEDDILTCPWHGYQYNLKNGALLSDPSARLDMYPVEIRESQIHLQIPRISKETIPVAIIEGQQEEAHTHPLSANEFLVKELGPGDIRLLYVGNEPVAVYNVAGRFFATQDACTHADGPLSEGSLRGSAVICPWHDSCFDVTNGAVLSGPATEPLKIYQVVIDGDVGRVV